MSSELKLSGTSGGNIILQGNDSITTDQVFTFPDVAGEYVVADATGNVDIGGGNIKLKADGSAELNRINVLKGISDPVTVNGVRIFNQGAGVALVSLDGASGTSTSTALQTNLAGNNYYFVRYDGTTGIGNDGGGSPNITLNSDGSAEFAAGNIRQFYANNGGNFEFWTGATPNGTLLFNSGAGGGDGAMVVRSFGTNGTGGGGVELVRNATSWGAFSQRSLKTALQPITDGLTKVSSLSAVTGRYKTDEEGTSRSFLIADEVQAVLPEAVSGDGTEENPLSLRYTEVIPLLVSALHDTKARIEALEAEVQALKGGNP